MDLSVICIGDELLDGRIRDRNGPVLGEFLEERGHRLVSQRTVPDDRQAIGGAIDEAGAEAPLVVVSGGLGPTEDDLTRRAAADWASVDLQLDESVLEWLEERFAERGYDFTPNNRTQCLFPEGARILQSEVGTAAGFALDEGRPEVWFLPGVPREFDWFVRTHLADRLDDQSTRPAATARLTFLGIGESTVETRIAEATELAEQRGIRVSFLADSPLVDVRLKGEDAAEVAEVRRMILEEIGDWQVAEGGESLAERLGRRLSEAGETVTTAESCTAGWLSKMITDVPGSSGWFEFGFVTYANRAKVEMLGVSSETLEAHGAVSPQTVVEMAAGARDRAGATYGLAISGVAGPTGGTDEKPVGTVDFALAGPEGVFTRRITFPARSRRSVRYSSVQTALGLLLWRLDGRLTRHDVDGPIAYD